MIQEINYLYQINALTYLLFDSGFMDPISKPQRYTGGASGGGATAPGATEAISQS